MSRNNIKSDLKAVTLVELLIAITLLSVVSLGFLSIEVFSRNQVESAQRRSKIQNEASLVLDHINKNVFMAFGNTEINPVSQAGDDEVVDIVLCGTDPSSDAYVGMAVYVEDTDGDGRPTSGVDRRVGYVFKRSVHTLKYIDHYPGGCSYSVSGEILSKRITGFTPVYTSDAAGTYHNYIDLQISACWDPSEAKYTCGTPNNPSVTMTTRVVMPMVSNK